MAIISTKHPLVPADYAPSEENEEYMNPTMLAYFHNKLTDWRAELLEQSNQTVKSLKEDSIQGPDLNDQATLEINTSLELRTRDRYRKLLNKIDAALRRIAEGEYGYCKETGEKIGVRRLEARAIAELTIEAQERHERYEKSHIDEDEDLHSI